MATRKTSPPEEDKPKKPSTKTRPNKPAEPAKPVRRKAPVKKAESKPAEKNDNPQAEQKKPRPRSPRNGVELPIGKPFKQGEEQRERARKAGLKSAALRKERKTFREHFLELLEITSKDAEGKEHTQQELILANMIKEARGGKNAVRAAEFIRDTLGEKMQEKVEVAVSLPKFENLDNAFAKMTGDAE